MPKKATIEILLIEKADEQANEEIEKQIFEFLSKYPPRIPWFEKVERVKVSEV